MRYPYLIWLIIFVFIPSIFVWIFNWRYLIKYKKTLIFITLGAVVWGLIFDLVLCVWQGAWFYTNHLNFTFLGLPLEEYLIMLFLPQQVASWFLLMRKHYGEI